MLCLTRSSSFTVLLERRRATGGDFRGVSLCGRRSSGAGSDKAETAADGVQDSFQRRLSETAFRRGGMYENYPAIHRGRPKPLYRDRVRPEELGDPQPGWDLGLPPG